ncbi:HAD family hydrolase [Micromonospora carbonacea]|uniref:HAD family hydrolase n=1 Tax=Micromonospora carbonacea TaxID=47853 RepID=UPI003D99056C
MPELVSCPDEVLGSLGLLRDDGWSVAIVTNGQADNQLGKIRRTGLDRCVDAWAVSAEVGIRKPARGIFEAAALGCGLDLRGGGWAIGDSPVLDVEGGRAAGLATVWVSRGRNGRRNSPHLIAPSRMSWPLSRCCGTRMPGGSCPTIRAVKSAVGIRAMASAGMSTPPWSESRLSDLARASRCWWEGFSVP